MSQVGREGREMEMGELLLAVVYVKYQDHVMKKRTLKVEIVKVVEWSQLGDVWNRFLGFLSLISDETSVNTVEQQQKQPNF